MSDVPGIGCTTGGTDRTLDGKRRDGLIALPIVVESREYEVMVTEHDIAPLGQRSRLHHAHPTACLTLSTSPLNAARGRTGIPVSDNGSLVPA